MPVPQNRTQSGAGLWHISVRCARFHEQLCVSIVVHGVFTIMEELRSTEVLDKEIRADAQKRAARILSKAEETVQAQLDGVEQRISQAREAALKKSQERIALYEKNINASLPLEKQRILVLHIHNAVIEALNGYFGSLGKKRRQDVVRTQVKAALPLLSGKSVNALVYGIPLADAKTFLSEELGDALVQCSEGADIQLANEAVPGFLFREGVVLVATDNSVVCRLTLDQKVKEILEDKTAELATALFGGRLPE